MNHVYRLIWREAAGGFVAVAEAARAGGARTSRSVRRAGVALGTLLAATAAQAAGTGFHVVDGSATIATSDGTTTVTQTTQGVRIDWQTLGVAPGEILKFTQPNTSAVALNVVKGGVPTEIQGQLQANGNVFILNPNGVLVGAGAQVSVGGFLASTADVGSFNTATGALVLVNHDSTAEVRNEGSIVVTQGGVVALVGNKVVNTGTIVAPGGGIYLLGGGRVEFKPGDGRPFTYTLTTDSARAINLVNTGTLRATGGQIAMDARSTMQAVVNTSGVVEAGAVSAGADGSIRLTALGGAGEVRASGTLDAGTTGTVTAELDEGGALYFSGSGAGNGEESITDWVRAKDKTYDGTDAATLALNLRKLDAFEGLYLSVGEARFASIHADMDIDVSVSLGGEHSSGPSLIQPDMLTATINAKEITTSVVTKTYDGTTTAEVVYNADDILSADRPYVRVSLNNGQFEDIHAGDDKGVSYKWRIDAAFDLISDYVLSGFSLGTITPKVIGTTVVTRSYDGTTTAQVVYNANDILARDKDALSVKILSADYNDKNAGDNKSVSYTWKLASQGVGTEVGDYKLMGSATGSITKASLTISTTDVIKTYDGTTSAAGNAVVVGETSLKGTDTLSGGSFVYDNKNAGTGKTVTVSGVTIADGNGGKNYDVTYIDNTNSAIGKAQLTLSAVADTKVADGTTTSSATPQFSGLVEGDTLGNLSQSFDGSAVGAHVINVDGTYTLSDGNGGNNYAVTLVSADGEITAPSTSNPPDLGTVINNGGSQPTPLNVDLAGLGDLLAQLPPTAAGEEDDPDKIKARRRSDRSPVRVTEGGVKSPPTLR